MDGSQYGVGEPGPATPGAPNRKASGAKRAAMDPAGAISGRMTARIVRLLEARGRDPAVLCAASGTSVEEVISPSARIPYRVADALLEACAKELGRDGLSLALAAVYDEDTYDAAALVLLTSPTFGQGLERALAFQRLWADGERFTLLPSSDSDDVVVRFRHPGQSVVARALATPGQRVTLLNRRAR